MLRMRKILTGCLTTVIVALLVPACHTDHPETSAAAMADTARFTNIQWLDSASFNSTVRSNCKNLNLKYNNNSVPM